MIDSGSSSTFIKESVAEKLKLYIIPRKKTISLADSKHVAKIIGEVVINIEINGQEHRGVVAEVIKNLCTDIIIGKDRLKKHRKVVFNFNGPEEDLIIGAIKNKQPRKTIPNTKQAETTTPFKNTSIKSTLPKTFGAVNINPPPLFTHLSNNMKPIATKSRRQSPSDLKYMKEEVEKLLNSNIIQHSVSPWRAQAFVTKEGTNHKRRMVVDYSETINLFTELDAYPMPNVLKMVQEISQYKYFSTFDLKSAYHQVPIKEEDRKYTAFEVDGQLWEFTRIPFGVTNGVSAFQRTIDKLIKVEKLKDTFTFVDNITICGKTKQEHDKNVNAFYKVIEKYNLTLNHDKTVQCTTSIKILGYTVGNNNISPDQDRLKPLLDMPPPTNLKSQKRIVGMFSYYSKFIGKFSDKIQLLNQNREFPVPSRVLKAFFILKNDLKDAALTSIDPEGDFTVETDASDFCIAATLSQQGRPVALFSRTLKPNEIKHHSVEKEAAAIVESIREWRHFLIGRKFQLITDQKSISFMFNNQRKSKIKNVKIARWRVELSQYKYDISYRPGKDNIVPDTFSRILSIGHPLQSLQSLHEQLCHPGITRLSHFIRYKNLPFSQDQIKIVTNTCKSCMYLKPQFLRNQGTLIKATAPFQRLSIDFKGPLPTSKKGNQYLLTLIDEYSRFPFAYPCPNMSSNSVTQCFNHLFSIFGMPDMIHNDRATDFLSEETQNYLLSKSIAASKTSRYNPKCNGQVEKLNGTLWKAIQVTLHSRKLKSSDWETVLPDALHSIRSLLCTATNATPHERLFNFPRKSTSGKAIPSWVKPGPVNIKNQPRKSKNDPPVSQAVLLHANPEYAHVRLPSGIQTTVSLRDIARHPDGVEEVLPNSDSTPIKLINSYETSTPEDITPPNTLIDNSTIYDTSFDNTNTKDPSQDKTVTNTLHNNIDTSTSQPVNKTDIIPSTPKVQLGRQRSSRTTKLPKKYEDFVME